MKKIKHIFSIALLTAMVNGQWSVVHAQSISRKVISSAGGTLSGGAYSLTYNLGEPAVHTLTAGGNMLTQGFEQPGEQIITGTVSPLSYCAGSAVSVPFNATDIGGGNTFTAQLSNASGSFAAPVNIGTLAGNAPGTINATIPSATPAGAGYRIRVISNSPGKAGSDNGTDISINSGPPSNGITAPSGPADACNGTVSLMTVNTVAGANAYSWNTGTNSSVVKFSNATGGPFVNGPFQTTTNQVYAKFEAVGGGQSGYQVCMQAVNGCGSSVNKCLWIRGVVSGPGPITPASGVVACPGTAQQYSCGLSGGATVYTWTLNGSTAAVSPNGGNNPTNVTVSFPTGFTSGQLCVTAALSCGGSSTSAPRCISISKNPANPNVPAGAATVCPGAAAVAYSIPGVTGATGYNWTVPANATLASGTNSPSITVNFPAPYNGTSSVCVTTTSACGAGAVKCKNVASGIPAQPAGITGPLTNVCGSTVQYSVVNPIASSYLWTNPAGTTISGSATGSTILLNISPTFTSGALTVAANSSLCAPATSAVRTGSTFWGRPNNPGTVTQNPPGAFCSGAFLNFSVVNPMTGPVPAYTWTSSNGVITSSQGPNNIDVTWGTNSQGIITVKAGNGCGLSAGTSSQTFTPNNCREEEGQGAGGSGSQQVTIYPNPAHDKITVSVYLADRESLDITLRDPAGRIIFSEDREGAEGWNAYEMDLNLLAKGVYTLAVQSATGSRMAKVVME
jgi:hypothetical protein